ncbi:MAG: hypothetical protein IPP57_10770 [Candidatus Obscuribacter sp.]|nr:hypothetical protein [Candidatus Obscuribacter sp.]
MSDAQYRLLIQRSFDEELNKQEHRALIEHLESSESGAKFHHQLDQMIQAAQDTPLPDELRPQNPEALARMTHGTTTTEKRLCLWFPRQFIQRVEQRQE